MSLIIIFRISQHATEQDQNLIPSLNLFRLFICMDAAGPRSARSPQVGGAGRLIMHVPFNLFGPRVKGPALPTPPSRTRRAPAAGGPTRNASTLRPRREQIDKSVYQLQRWRLGEVCPLMTRENDHMNIIIRFPRFHDKTEK